MLPDFTYHPVSHMSLRHISEPVKNDVREVSCSGTSVQRGDEVKVEGEVGSQATLLVPVVQHCVRNVGIGLSQQNSN